MPRAPTDIVLQIIQCVIWELITCERTFQLKLVKGEFHEGIANACKVYRGIYMFEWSRRLTLRGVEDWKFVIEHNLALNVRELILGENALPNHSAVKANLDFSRFDLIHTLTLDCHNDVGHSASAGIKGQWSYKKIIPSLPRKLKSLIILNAHGPDLQVIHKAIKQCEGLESLTLGRCTKFNRVKRCDFWENFPNDHDSYFSGKGVDGYANALGTELQGLPNLKSIFVNVYLTDTKYLNEPNTATLPTAHTPQPQPLPAAAGIITMATKFTPESQAQAQLPPVESNVAQNEQAGTESNDRKETEEAEKVAANVLFESHPSLQMAGFISYWSKDHLGWSVQQRKQENQLKSPDPGGEVDANPNVDYFQSS